MNANERVDLRVGIFVTAGLALILGFIVMLGGNSSVFVSKRQYKARFDQVQGLSVGSIVSLAGVDVGNISDLKFIPGSNFIEVHMEINEKLADRITAESVASVKTQGALGDKYIYITPGEPGSKPLPEDSLIKAESGEDLLEAIAEKGPEMLKIVEVIEEARKWMSSLNENNRTVVLVENMVKASESLDQTLKEARLAIRELREIQNDKNGLQEGIQRFSNVMKKLDEGKGSLGAIINDPALHDRLMSLLGEPPRQKYLKPLIRATIKESDRSK